MSAATPQTGMGSHYPQIAGSHPGQGSHQRWQEGVLHRPHICSLFSSPSTSRLPLHSTLPIQVPLQSFQQLPSEGETARRQKARVPQLTPKIRCHTSLFIPAHSSSSLHAQLFIPAQTAHHPCMCTVLHSCMCRFSSSPIIAAHRSSSLHTQLFIPAQTAHHPCTQFFIPARTAFHPCTHAQLFIPAQTAHHPCMCTVLHSCMCSFSSLHK